MREVYSHSRLSSFESCPQKFYYRYIQKLPAPSEGIEGFVGKRVHEVLERLYLFAARGLVPSLAKVVNRYHTLFDEHHDPARVRIVREEPLSHYRAMGERCVSNYYRRHYPFDGDETVGLEQHVSFALDTEGAYQMRGIVDRIARTRDGGIEIQDYKTSQRVPSQKVLDRDRQLALYQLALSERYGKDGPITLVWHYVSAGKTRTSTRTPEQLEELRCETMALIDRIRAESAFEARPGPLCRWCEYNDRCPAVARPVGDAAESAIPRLDPVEAPGQQRLL